ncbi:hypothetical protein HRbin36_01108 [bacterium HR36]|nr:hypothetical protein HRbin36_01108 [bacterium HR36]
MLANQLASYGDGLAMSFVRLGQTSRTAKQNAQIVPDMRRLALHPGAFGKLGLRTPQRFQGLTV